MEKIANNFGTLFCYGTLFCLRDLDTSKILSKKNAVKATQFVLFNIVLLEVIRKISHHTLRPYLAHFFDRKTIKYFPSGYFLFTTSFALQAIAWQSFPSQKERSHTIRTVVPSWLFHALSCLALAKYAYSSITLVGRKITPISFAGGAILGLIHGLTGAYLAHKD
ncbi:MAG: hypothetical protein KDK63_01525 [Chlamydiia bacterium]|nr:hypothetical protein [Chlamydiia bacterium]